MSNAHSAPRGRITIERRYRAQLADVWDLWATKDGIESWWGPGGFAVTVREMDLRPGGRLVYAMTAVEPAMVDFMKKSGMPTTTEARLTYTRIVPHARIEYVHVADFIPGVEPYDVATVVEFEATGDDVRMVVSFDPMHDDEWTTRATMGWEGQLAKAATVLAARTAQP